MDGKRFVLVKPGDVLVFGGVGDLDPAVAEELVGQLRDRVGIEHVAFFAADIEMDAVPAPATAREA
ncbi:hypothetical protein [Micromonospora sp. WMMD998]|uniref:hypothetical protein n=1 Tax=Micromonospora sp. WMMD998 TaxID=3016092 RepID=UPI00249C63F0|nr:hypothetical protein [Micromonospora sp. WMMD998]WFE41945.1 hypothetical protein O7619_27255 [Micromonospora sp. WMMD998]